MATNADKPAVAAKKTVKRRPVKEKAMRPVKEKAAHKAPAKKSVAKEAPARPKVKRAVKKKMVMPRTPEQDQPVTSEAASLPAKPKESAPRKEAADAPAKRRAPAPVPSAKAIQEAVTARAVRGVRSRDVTSFLRQLIMMLNAGTPLLKSLKSLSRRGEHQGIRDLVGGMTEYVEAGNPLWQAFARYKEFDPVFVNLIKASEASGTLTTVLARLVSYRETREMLAKRVRAAMIYPMLVLIFCFAVLVVIAKFVIPELVSMFEKFDVEIPWQTNALVAVSDFMGTWWWALLLGIAGLVALYKLWFVRSPVRRMAADRLKLKIPILRGILRKNSIVDFTQTFALMLRSGLSMMATLDLCRNAVRNRAYINPIQEMRDSVERGEGLEQPMRNAERSGLFPGVVVDMLITGEESGSVDEIAEQIGDIYQKEVEIEVASIGETIQPVMTVFLGGIVMLVAYSLFGPLVQMIEKISAGAAF